MKENIEKFGESSILNKEIDEASESELADKLSVDKKRTGEKYQIEIKGELIDLFEKSYFKMLNTIDELSGGISIEEIKKYDEEFKKRFGFDIKKLKDIIDAKIPEIIERINVLSKEGDIHIISENSLRDVLSNSLINSLGTVLWFRKNINSDEESIKNRMNDSESGRRESLNEAQELINSSELDYYFKTLCFSDDRLKMEVGEEQGYLSKFIDFFKENKYGKNYPTGAKKLPYFRFFSELEAGNIKGKKVAEDENKYLDLEKELEKLDDDIVDKNKIRKSNLIR